MYSSCLFTKPSQPEAIPYRILSKHSDRCSSRRGVAVDRLSYDAAVTFSPLSTKHKHVWKWLILLLLREWVPLAEVATTDAFFFRRIGAMTRALTLKVNSYFWLIWLINARGSDVCQKIGQWNDLKTKETISKILLLVIENVSREKRQSLLVPRKNRDNSLQVSA